MDIHKKPGLYHPERACAQGTAGLFHKGMSGHRDGPPQNDPIPTHPGGTAINGGTAIPGHPARRSRRSIPAIPAIPAIPEFNGLGVEPKGPEQA